MSTYRAVMLKGRGLDQLQETVLPLSEPGLASCVSGCGRAGQAPTDITMRTGYHHPYAPKFPRSCGGTRWWARSMLSALG